MNLLTNLLPGLRDSRTPLSAAMIWLLAGILWLPLLDYEEWNFSWFENFKFLSQEEPRQAAFGTILIFLLAYLLGIVTLAVGRALGVAIAAAISVFVALAFPIVVLVGTVGLGSWLIFSWIPAHLLSMMWIAVQVAFWLTLLFVTMYLNRGSAIVGFLFYQLVEARSHVRQLPRPCMMAKLLLSFLGDIWRRADWELYHTASEAAYIRRAVATHIMETLVASEEQQSAIVRSLPLRFCISLSRDYHVPIPDSAALNVDDPAWLQRAKLLVKWHTLSEKRRDVIRSDFQVRILSRLSTDREALRRFLALYINPPRSLESMAERKMASAPLQLKARHPAVYEEYDRQETEGEFRCAVSFPLSATVFALVWNIAPVSVPGSVVFVLAVVLAASAGLLMLTLGSLRLRESRRTLARCAEGGLVDVGLPVWQLAPDLTLRSGITSGKLKYQTMGPGGPPTSEVTESSDK